MSLALYVLGWVIFVVGLSIGAHLMHMPPRWIAVGDVILVGLGLIMVVTGTRHRDPSQ